MDRKNQLFMRKGEGNMFLSNEHVWTLRKARNICKPNDTVPIVEAMIVEAVIVEVVVVEAVIDKPRIRGKERDQTQSTNQFVPSVTLVTFRSKSYDHIW